MSRCGTVSRVDEQTRDRPRPWARALVGAIAFAAAFALLFTTFLAEHAMLPRVVGSAAGGGMLGGAAIAAISASRNRPLFAFLLGLTTAFVGGPIAATLTLFVEGLQQGAGLRSFGAVIVAALGMMCGWFISIPVGIVLGLFLALLVFVVDRIPGSRSR